MSETLNSSLLMMTEVPHEPGAFVALLERSGIEAVGEWTAKKNASMMTTMAAWPLSPSPASAAIEPMLEALCHASFPAGYPHYGGPPPAPAIVRSAI